MTAIVPPAAPSVPVYPALGSPTFNLGAYTFGTAMPGIVSGIDALVANAYANATEAYNRATNAANSEVSAANSANVALGAANFKGNWAAGTYLMPSCVKHGGRFWLVGVASTTGTPGVSPDWLPLDAGIVPTALITGSTTAVIGVRYLLAATGITLTAPTTWLKGDYFGFREVAGLMGAIVDFGATKVRGLTAGSVVIDAPRQGMDLYYEDATRGLI